jgi:hypothetical protein
MKRFLITAATTLGLKLSVTAPAHADPAPTGNRPVKGDHLAVADWRMS